jgi:galactokinase
MIFSPFEMEDSVPHVKSLQEIYYDDDFAFQSERWGKLLSRFEDLHGHVASFVSRSAGRINIIGEHIDYNMYEVRAILDLE